MIIALLALAFAMIVGGLLSVFFGWDIVLIERGWTMVLAGSFSASCGALLLGITAAVSRLARIQFELSRLQSGFDEDVRDPEEAPSSSTGVSMAALAGGLLGGKMLGRGETKQQDEKTAEPAPFSGGVDLDSSDEKPAAQESEQPKADEPFLPFPPRTVAESTEDRDEEAPEIKVPDFLLADRLRDTYDDSRTAQAEVTLFADEPKLDEAEDMRQRPSDSDDDRLEPISIKEPEPVLEPEPAHEPEPVSAFEDERAAPVEPVQEEKEPEAPRSDATVIGTYNSGDNTYVMFSDGSIEAQTPSGVFHFQSLDELKAFIASGGEGTSSSI